MKPTLFVALALLAASRAFAQDAPSVRIISDQDIQLESVQQQELKQWTDDVRSYQRWYQRNKNRISRNVFGGVGDRREIPTVPEWLPGKCDLLSEFDPPPAGTLSAGCNLLSFFESNFTVDPAVQQVVQAQKQNEEDPHRSFWKHVHLDAGWTSLDYRSHAYGLIGVHITLPELAKRVQIYLPPGFLLLSMPDGFGGREFKPAATIGVSIKMFRFVFPQGKEGTAYFNLAKAYVINRASSSMDVRPDVDLIGLSFSWGR